MNKFTKIITAIMYSIAIVCTMGITLQARGQSGNGSHNGHEYVDLGLPSGTLWATCNVGAGTPEASGYYFAWGETQPKPTFSVSNCKYFVFDAHLYRFYQERGEAIHGNEERWYKMTKYSDSDHLTILQPDDDAATVQWGNGWRTPTYDEWNELIAYCTPKPADSIGVSGILFKAPNGNSLFLPAIGIRQDNELKYRTNCNYWSSSLAIDDKSDAIFFLSGAWSELNIGERYMGMPVRAVRSAQ